MTKLTPGEEVMIGALARQVKDGDWAACGTRSPMPAAALGLARLTHAPRAEVFVAGSRDWPCAGEWREFFDLGPPAPRLVSLHPGVDLDEVCQLTGFAFRATTDPLATPPLDPEARRLLYGPVREKLAQVYPRGAARLTRPDG
jgi:hypothetical protein